MAELRVSAWKRFGHDRLYVNLPDGTSVAWLDRRTGSLTVTDPRYHQAALAALRTARAVPRPTAPPPRARPKAPPRRTPTTGPGTPTGRDTPPRPGTPPASPPRPQSSAPGRVVPPPPDFAPHPAPVGAPAPDLADNLPGATLRARLELTGPSRLERLLILLRLRPDRMASWRTGLKGEQVVGAELGRLARHGWRVIHSIELSPHNDMDHLLIGPGGVFTINTKRHPGKTVWVGDDMARINHGPPRPHPRNSRAEAERAHRTLRRHCAFPFEVHPVLVYVDTEPPRVAPTQRTVRVYQPRQLSSLAPLTGTLTPAQITHLHTVARHPSTWQPS
ncbi:NERD domain-containing protein [Streptomyces sp. SID4919]|uniref:nuclease-related domain-containing protein n=1 Tax=unclassified Streptomyces TaxID=2593676 RepID=UPI000823AFB9|nr:nuclease-related domain-containing protein [Streptomyces sp. AmelKG-E11A]MYY12589.1 NERD domain-containing protein [Streptomyces sp. SID4919]SCK19427.1 Nuclease-related domain-containing protein [Streptomyces sp. AmelKG-E11A]